MTLLLTVCSGAWADDYTVSNPATKTYAELTFLDVVNTATNTTISASSTDCIAYDIYYLAKTVKPAWYFGGNSNFAGTSDTYTYSTAAEEGFLPVGSENSNSYTYSKLKGGKITSDAGRARGVYVTGITAVAILGNDAGNSSNKWLKLIVDEVKSDGTTTNVGTKESSKNSNTHVVDFGTTLDKSKYYKVTVHSDGTANCWFNQIRFVPGSKKATSSLSFTSTSGSADINDGVSAFSLPAFSAKNPSSMTVTYSSSKPTVATVDASTGAVTLVAPGTTTITASFAGDDEYDEASATYTLTVTDRTMSTFGYTETIDEDNKTLAARALTGIDHLTLTQAHGSKVTDYASRSVTVYLNGTEYTNTNTWYKTVNTSAYDDDQWVGYDVAIDNGYALNLANIYNRLIVSDDCSITWKVVISDSNNSVLYTSNNKNTTRAATGVLSDELSLTNLTGTIHVRIYMYQGGTTKGFSMDQFLLTGKVVEDTRTEYTVTFAAGAGLGTVPSDETVREGDTFTIPSAPLLYKEGYTLTKWNDGTNNHAVGSSLTITDDVDLTAVFEENTAELGDAAVEVAWTFKTSEGAPTIAIEGNSQTAVYSKNVTINNIAYDALMTIDASNGKFNNTYNTGYAQVSDGTVFTIPAVYNMEVTFKCNQNTSGVSDVTFAGDNADAANGTVLTYNYKGIASTIDILVSNGSLYPEYISVSYPVAMTQYATPTITAETDFNFENKGYKVTITAEDGTLQISTDGTTYSEQTSPYVTYATTTTTYYAKVTGVLTASEIAEKKVTNTYDTSKSYVAWVYKKGYGSASYAFATDPMVTELKKLYNVVEVNYADGDTPAEDLSNADLIVCSEAMTGNKTSSNGMKAFAGVTPMIGLKAYNYTKGRWSWGTPANPSSTQQTFTPKATNYRVLDGVTFEPNGDIKLATATSGNVIQTVEFGTTDCTAPDGNTIIGTVGSDDTKAVMYASNKYFGLGLSSDCWSTYTDNAITIVKNAAALLIAGESLTGTDDNIDRKVTGTITVSGWNTFSSVFPLDLSTITSDEDVAAYYASAASGSTVTLKTTEDMVPAEEGLMIKGTANKSFTIDVAASGTAISGNLLVGLPNGGEVTKDNGNYVFGWTDPTSPGFYLVDADSTEPTLAVGKAYLHVASNNNARLSIVFDDEATGIDATLMNSEKVNSEVYNLNGQRVMNPAKGLYIVNGKKVVIK